MLFFKSFKIIFIFIELTLSLTSTYNLLFPDEYIVPKRIWLYWEGSFDDMLKFCFHGLKQNINNYEIILLNTNTVRCYVNSREIPSNIKTLSLANQADYYRFQLLTQYGGIWMDASCYVKNDEVLDELIDEMNEKKAELLAFNFKYHPQNNIEIGILFSPRDSEFLKKVFYYYVLGLKKDRLIIMKKMMKEGMILNSTKQYRYNKTTSEKFYDTYFYANYCVQYVLQILNKGSSNIIIKRAEDWSFKFQKDNYWNGNSMKKKLLEDNGLDEYKLIKFTGKNRKLMKLIYNISVI